MFSDEAESAKELQQIRDWYRYHEQQIEIKFKALNTDALEEIRNKMKRKQTKHENDENIERLSREREKIIEKMKEHVRDCEHPHCSIVKDIILHYNLRHIHEAKTDNVYFIVKYGNCTGYTKTDCPVGSQINQKMLETHRIFKNM